MTHVDTGETMETSTSPPKRAYGVIVAGLILIVVGVLWLLDVLEVVDLRFAVVVPAVLAVIGLTLIIGSFDGPHTGMVIAGVFLTGATIALAIAPEGVFTGGIGERTYTIVDQSDLADRYALGMGEMTIDMSGLELTDSATVEVSLGAGEMTIILPEDLEVRVDAGAGAGQVNILGDQEEGLSVSLTHVSDGFDTAEVTLTLDLHVAAGEIRVDR